MPCFELSVSLCQRIQSALTRFWWDASPDEKKMCWISWDKLTAPKTLEGLGIRDIQAFNKALLVKHAWRIVTKPEYLLSKVLRGKYCSKASFLETEAPKVASHGWRGILGGRDLLLSNLTKVIGDGEGTRLWKDPWLSSIIPLRPMGPMQEKHQDLMVADLLCRETREWNLLKISEILPESLPAIISIKPSITGALDSYAWLGSRTGAYTVNSGYFAAVSTEVEITTDTNLYKAIWKCKVSPKTQIFLWKIAKGALALGENLAKRGLHHNTGCKHCGDLETANYVFLHCSFTRRVWDSLHLWTTDFKPTTYASFSEAFLATIKLVNLPPLGVTENIFPWIIWGIWIARNLLVFENRASTPAEIISRSIRNAQEWTMAQASSSQKQSTAPHVLITPLPPSTVLCFTDAAWQATTRRTGCGWIFFTPQGERLDQGTSMFEHTSTPQMAEGLAIRSALIHARTAGYSRICIKSYCQALVVTITSKNHPADLYGITRDIEHLSLSFDFIVFSFVPRNLNSIADSLAKSVLY